tara:strand:+ start:5109 stop:5783 length:675 start_codon:yes stop_codon:yes gene_type:complete
MKRLFTGLFLGILVLLFVFYTNNLFFAIILVSILLFSLYELLRLKVKLNLFSGITLLFILLNLALVYPITEIFSRNLFFTALLISVIADVSALSMGKLFGKKIIFPDISPNKTLEGFISGIFFPATFILLISYLAQFEFKIINILFQFIEIKPMLISFGYILTFSALVACSMMSVIGDLIASKTKRLLEIKDFGDLLPGHGGFLDRLDSHLICIPVFLFINSLI